MATTSDGVAAVEEAAPDALAGAVRTAVELATVLPVPVADKVAYPVPARVGLVAPVTSTCRTFSRVTSADPRVMVATSSVLLPEASDRATVETG